MVPIVLGSLASRSFFSSEMMDRALNELFSVCGKLVVFRSSPNDCWCDKLASRTWRINLW